MRPLSLSCRPCALEIYTFLGSSPWMFGGNPSEPRVGGWLSCHSETHLRRLKFFFLATGPNSSPERLYGCTSRKTNAMGASDDAVEKVYSSSEPPPETGGAKMDSGEARLRDLGYKQELRREWGVLSSFSGSLGLMAYTTQITGNSSSSLSTKSLFSRTLPKPAACTSSTDPLPVCLSQCCTIDHLPDLVLYQFRVQQEQQQ